MAGNGNKKAHGAPIPMESRTGQTFGQSSDVVEERIRVVIRVGRFSAELEPDQVPDRLAARIISYLKAGMAGPEEPAQLPPPKTPVPNTGGEPREDE